MRPHDVDLNFEVPVHLRVPARLYQKARAAHSRGRSPEEAVGGLRVITVSDFFAGAGGSSTHRTMSSGHTVRRDGVILSKRGLPLRPHSVDGYRRVSIDGKRFMVHVLVAAAFLGRCPEGHQVNHIDGDKSNNALANLEYVTPAENVRHSIDVLGVVRAPGESNGNAKLTDADVREMRRLHAEGMNAADVGRRFGIDPGHAWRIVTNRSWRHVA